MLRVIIVDRPSGSLRTEHPLIVKHGPGLNKTLRTIHTKLTMSEANKTVAGEGKRAHAQQLPARVRRRHDRERA